MPKHPDEDGLITCTKCERDLPGDVEHFHRRGDGFRYRCKECRGGSFGVTDINKVKDAKDGHKFCSKCHKELPATSEYFFNGGKSSNGLTSECKKCRGADEYGVQRLNVVKDGDAGKRFCDGCRKQYPATREYFFIGPDGELNGKCKECRGYQHGIKRQNVGRRDGTWVCSTCKEEYEESLENFPPGNNKNGLASRCRDCESTRKHLLRDQRNEKAGGKLTGVEWSNLKDAWGDKCAYCGDGDTSLQRDHVVAVNNGGGTVVENIVPACQTCNASKGAKSVSEWYPNQSFYDETREARIIHVSYDRF